MLLEEGSEKAELKQEAKLNPLLPAFVQCQKHSRNCFPAKDLLFCLTLLQAVVFL